jgi:hypothetical protein
VGFVRIERSLLLNVLSISFIETIGRGAFSFTLNNGVRLHSGPAYRETRFEVSLPATPVSVLRGASSPQ